MLWGDPDRPENFIELMASLESPEEIENYIGFLKATRVFETAAGNLIENQNVVGFRVEEKGISPQQHQDAQNTKDKQIARAATLERPLKLEKKALAKDPAPKDLLGPPIDHAYSEIEQKEQRPQKRSVKQSEVKPQDQQEEKEPLDKRPAQVGVKRDTANKKPPDAKIKLDAEKYLALLLRNNETGISVDSGARWTPELSEEFRYRNRDGKFDDFVFSKILPNLLFLTWNRSADAFKFDFPVTKNRINMRKMSSDLPTDVALIFYDALKRWKKVKEDHLRTQPMRVGSHGEMIYPIPFNRIGGIQYTTSPEKFLETLEAQLKQAGAIP